jgi:hypothetical protein
MALRTDWTLPLESDSSPGPLHASCAVGVSTIHSFTKRSLAGRLGTSYATLVTNILLYDYMESTLIWRSLFQPPCFLKNGCHGRGMPSNTSPRPHARCSLQQREQHTGARDLTYRHQGINRVLCNSQALVSYAPQTSCHHPGFNLQKEAYRALLARRAERKSLLHARERGGDVMFKFAAPRI